MHFSSSKPVWFGVALPFTNDNKENNHPQGDYDGSSYSNGDGAILYRDDNDFDGKSFGFVSNHSSFHYVSLSTFDVLTSLLEGN